MTTSLKIDCNDLDDVTQVVKQLEAALEQTVLPQVPFQVRVRVRRKGAAVIKRPGGEIIDAGVVNSLIARIVGAKAGGALQGITAAIFDGESQPGLDIDISPLA